jgi:deoxyribodipyrimidine photolyase-related protein
MGFINGNKKIVIFIYIMLVLFNNQLFNYKILEPIIKKYNIKKIILLEIAEFYEKREINLKLNNLRVTYQYALFRHYRDYLDNFIKTIIISDMKKFPKKELIENLDDNIVYFDIVDNIVESLFLKFCEKYESIKLDSPSFLAKDHELENFRDKHLQQAYFMNYIKKKMSMDVLKSTDIQNRNKFDNIKIPEANLTFNFNKKYVTEGMKLSNNYGPKNILEKIKYLPFTHNDVLKLYKKFLKERFSNFAKYQDSIVSGEQILFHSKMSIYINFGLITPKEILDILESFISKNNIKKDNNYEAFIRQIFWREYSRLYYRVVEPSKYKKNIFGNKKRITDHYYNATTPCPLVNETIKDAFEYGYLHHIRRLMIMSNYMNLSGITPNDIYKWMYEFSLDSWDWVMVFNVYSMGSWSDAGYAMRKPYISSSNYLKKMSIIDSESAEIFDDLFNDFIKKHKNVLVKTQLASLYR